MSRAISSTLGILSMNWFSLIAICTSSPEPTMRATSCTALRGTMPDIAGPAEGIPTLVVGYREGGLPEHLAQDLAVDGQPASARPVAHRGELLGGQADQPKRRA